MIRPPFAARVAVGLAVTVVEEARRLPTTAISLPMTAISQVLQSSMRLQQSVTELAIKGDQLFALLSGPPSETASWATFDDDEDDTTSSNKSGNGVATDYVADGIREADDVDVPDPAESTVAAAPGRFALYSTPPTDTALKDIASGDTAPNSTAPTNTAPNNTAPDRTASNRTAPNGTASNGRPSGPGTGRAAARKKAAAGGTNTGSAAGKSAGKTSTVAVPELAEYLDYDSLTLAQLRARLRTLSVDELTVLLDYENASSRRAPFQTMLTNRITTARAT